MRSSGDSRIDGGGAVTTCPYDGTPAFFISVMK